MVVVIVVHLVRTSLSAEPLTTHYTETPLVSIAHINDNLAQRGVRMLRTPGQKTKGKLLHFLYEERVLWRADDIVHTRTLEVTSRPVEDVLNNVLPTHLKTKPTIHHFYPTSGPQPLVHQTYPLSTHFIALSHFSGFLIYSRIYQNVKKFSTSSPKTKKKEYGRD